MNFEEAERTLLRARSRQAGKVVQNNTRLFFRDPHYAIQLHATDVVEIHPDNQWRLFTGGWLTPTTKERINHYSPARVYSDGGQWYVGWNHHEPTPWFEGVEVDEHGLVLNGVSAPPDPKPYRRRVDRLVRRYIQNFAALMGEHGLPDPSGADCWGCYFKMCSATGQTADSQAYGQAQRQKGGLEHMGYSHYMDHLTEPYYVPSLLWHAIRSRGYADPRVIWEMCKERPGDWIPDILRSFFKTIKPHLVELLMTEEHANEVSKE